MATDNTRRYSNNEYDTFIFQKNKINYLKSCCIIILWKNPLIQA